MFIVRNMTELTNIELAELISVNRTLLADEKATMDAANAALEEQIGAMNAKLADAIAQEQSELSLLLEQNQSFDEVSLDARLAQLQQVEAEFDAKTTEYQAMVVANNDLAAKIMERFQGNLTRVKAVKGQAEQLKTKLSKLSSMIDTLVGKN